MLTASSMATLHFLGQNNKNEVLHDFLVSDSTATGSCDANAIVSGTNPFLRSRELKWGA